MASSSSRPLLRRLAELARGRVRANHRMLSSASSSTAAIERASQSPAEAQAVRRSDPKPNPIPLVPHRATAYPPAAAAASAAAMASSSSRPLLRRLAELARGRVRANHRMLSSASSSTAAIERASQSPAEAQAVRMTEGCVRRLKELHAKEPSAEGKMLRLSVEAGGCSGFQYSFALDDKKNSDDRVFETDGVKLVVDDISYDFVKGATVDYEEELIRSAFVVSTNPSAVGGCSCKSSFMVK